MRPTLSSLLLVSALTLAAAACGTPHFMEADEPAQATTPPPPTQAAPPPAPAPARPQPAVAADPHLFLSPHTMRSKRTIVYPARAATNTAAGTHEYLQSGKWKPITTKHVVTTRAVNVAELRVGHHVVYRDVTTRDDDGHYIPVPDMSKSYHRHANFEMSVVVRPPDAKGMIITSSGRRVQAAAAQLVTSREAETVNIDAAGDRDCINPNHWIVAKWAPGRTGQAHGKIGVLLSQPAGVKSAKKRYLNFYQGAEQIAAHAWKTRPATAADIKPGAVVFTTYVTRWTCAHLLTAHWQRTVVENTNDLPLGIVKLRGAVKPQKLSQLRVLAN